MELKEIALRQLRDYDSKTPGTVFGEGLSLTLPEAYEVQAEVARLREARGEKVIGYKAGVTSPVFQKNLGVDSPVMGRLFDSEYTSSGASLPRSRFCELAIEGELAVSLAHDLPAGTKTDAEIEAAIGSVFAVIELHNRVFRSAGNTVVELVANNAIHAGVVASNQSQPGLVNSTGGLEIFMDGDKIATVSNEDLSRTVVSSLRWFVTSSILRGEGLRKGQIILCGTVAGLYPVIAAHRVDVITDAYGTASCKIED